MVNTQDEDDEFLGIATFVIPEQDGSPRFVRFCTPSGRMGLYCKTCTPDRIIFLAHRDCWKVVNRPVLISSRQLLRLAQHTRPLAPRQNEDAHDRDLSHQTHLDQFDVGTPLGRLLRGVSRRLPRELQGYILDYLGGSFFASLLKARIIVPPLLCRLNPCNSVEWRTIGGGTVATTTRLYARSLNLLGRAYLTGIGVNQTEAVSVPITTTNVRGLQYALGEFGLRAVRILYEDKSCSPWLGDPSCTWLGTTMGRDLNTLYALADVSCFTQ